MDKATSIVTHLRMWCGTLEVMFTGDITRRWNVISRSMREQDSAIDERAEVQQFNWIQVYILKFALSRWYQMIGLFIRAVPLIFDRQERRRNSLSRRQKNDSK